MSEHYIEDGNLSFAWGKALRLVSKRGRSEMAPLIVSFTGFDDRGSVLEDTAIRSILDELLQEDGLQSVKTVGGTIFPVSLWNPNVSRTQFFERYRRIIPRLRKVSSKNKRGLYFERMISCGPENNTNQLDFVISHYLSRRGVRRSALQVAIFDPMQDHSKAAQLGFPCLQHVTFAPIKNCTSLSVNAFYASQYMVERAYGNYLGLCSLGKFVAHELSLKLERVTCYSGIALLDSGIRKARLKPLIEIVNQLSPLKDI